MIPVSFGSGGRFPVAPPWLTRILALLGAIALSLTGAFGCNVFSVTSATAHAGELVQIKGTLALDTGKKAAGVGATLDLGNQLTFEGNGPGSKGCTLTTVSDPTGTAANLVWISPDKHRARFTLINMDQWTGDGTTILDVVFCQVRIPGNTPVGSYPITITQSELAHGLGQPMQLDVAGGTINVVP